MDCSSNVLRQPDRRGDIEIDKGIVLDSVPGLDRNKSMMDCRDLGGRVRCHLRRPLDEIIDAGRARRRSDG